MADPGKSVDSDWETVSAPSEWETVSQPSSAASRFGGSLWESSPVAGAINTLKRYGWDLSAPAAQALQSGNWSQAAQEVGKQALLSAFPALPIAADIVRGSTESGRQAYQQAQAGKPGQAAISAVGTIPIAGPMIAQPAEQFMRGDIAGGLGTAAGEALSLGLPEAVRLPGKVAPGVAESLTAGAEQNWYRALNPTKEANKALTRDVVAPGLVERGVKATSRDDLINQAEQHIENYGQRIDDYAAAHGDETVDTVSLLNRIEDLKNQASRKGVVATVRQPYMDQLGDLENDIKALMKKNGGTLTLSDLRFLRQEYDIPVAAKGGFALPVADQTKLAAIKNGVNTMRAEIAEGHPELADDNKEFSFWSRVNEVADATGLRRVGQRTPLTERMAQASGAAVGGAMFGPKGAIMGAKAGGMLAKMQNTVWWNSLSAANKMKIADLIQQGRSLDALRLASGAASAAAVGENTAVNPEQLAVAIGR